MRAMCITSCYADRIHSRKRNATVWRPSVRLSVGVSVCPVGILSVTHQEAADDVASRHFGPTIRRTEIVV